MNQILDILIRWRTALLGFALAAAAVLPAILNAPEVLAIIPAQYHPYATALAFLLLWATRWRPASRAADPEVQVKKAIEATAETSVITIKEAGQTTATIRA